MASDPQHNAHWPELRAMLAEVYLPEGVDLWLSCSHKQFGGMTVEQMFEAGRADEVLAVAERLVTGTFS